jgi:hypothetical protein|tara:strand:+ start:727 stop:2130 length:1404 start_codon:yes stop_codon:yes gene_type:complete
MAISIDQRPLYEVLPIGQQVIFSVSENTIVATKYKVKFIAEVHVSNTAIVPATTDTLIGTFKTTPNNAGVGIFDLRPILETFVSPDHEPSSYAEYKNTDFQNTPFPIHLIDMYSLSDQSIKFFAVRFLIEYSDTPNGPIIPPTDASNNNDTDSDQYTIFNGVLQYDDVLTASSVNYGYNLQEFYLTDTDSKFLTNAPTTQYARLTDYGTFPFLNFLPDSTDAVTTFHLKYYDSTGSLLNNELVQNTVPNGGAAIAGSLSNTRINYLGAFPANLRGDGSTMFAGLVAAGTIQGGYYTIQDSGAGSSLYRVNILCPNERGYEGIRLTWLNQWGVWDYYTFNMKSTRSITTNRTSYTQQGGTWNESTFKIKGYKGGKKNFRVNSTEKISLNTDFVTEAEGVWFEELINSTDVYIVNGYSEGENIFKITNKYIEPVVLTTSSYVKKTIANDKLMQYTIEIEKSKMQRTQSV